MSKSNPFNSKKSTAGKPTSLVAAQTTSTTSTRSNTSLKTDGLKSDSGGIGRTSSSIDFGRPSNNKAAADTSSSNSGSGWSKLLEQTTSGGISGALSGSFSLGALGGIGSIVSGIVDLFGGGGKKAKTTLPPLPEFSLPKQSVQTAYLSSTGISVRDGASSQLPNLPSGNAPVYSGNQTSSSSDWIQSQNTQIAQAVKTALLSSNSLSDVIAEI